MNKHGEVLIVDDLPLNVSLMSDLVRKIDGLQPVGFNDPGPALVWCSRNAPVLALVDYEMPTMSGSQFIAKLRAQEQGQIVPIVMVTAETDRGKLLQALDAGANEFLRKPLDDLEALARVRSMSQLGLAARRAAELAVTDDLTGLGNRRHFLSQLDAEVKRSHRHGHDLSLVMLDVDHFKEVNDNYGHEAGDAVLRELAQRVRTLIREVDFVGRLGGEEFGLGTTRNLPQRCCRRCRAPPASIKRPALRPRTDNDRELRRCDASATGRLSFLAPSCGSVPLRGEARRPQSGSR